MKELIKRAINEFTERNPQANLVSDASREILADFIDKYVHDNKSGGCFGSSCCRDRKKSQ